LRRLLASIIRGAISNRRPGAEKLAVLIEGDGSIPHPYALARMLFMPRQLQQAGLVSDHMDVGTAKAPLADILKWAERFDPVNRTSYLELRHYMPNTLLRDSDFMSMAHGLELRVPFIDHKLAEFLFRIPGASKLERGLPKWLLIEAVKGLLPEQVVHRPKRGFTFPFELWLKKEMRQDMEDVLLDTSATLLTGINRKFVATIWKDFLAGKTTWSRPWSLYVLNRWVHTFLESRPSSSTVDIPELGRRQAMARN
jgi:asparagine synthase (glutamine-hydrolysing)